MKYVEDEIINLEDDINDETQCPSLPCGQPMIENPVDNSSDNIEEISSDNTNTSNFNEHVFPNVHILSNYNDDNDTEVNSIVIIH